VANNINEIRIKNHPLFRVLKAGHGKNEHRFFLTNLRSSDLHPFPSDVSGIAAIVPSLSSVFSSLLVLKEGSCTIWVKSEAGGELELIH
jgi:hypothetical protein